MEADKIFKEGNIQGKEKKIKEWRLKKNNTQNNLLKRKQEPEKEEFEHLEKS